MSETGEMKMTMDHQIAQLLDALYRRMDELEHPPLEELTPVLARYYFQEGRKFFKPLHVPNVEMVNTFIQREEAALPIRLYIPKRRISPLPVLVYFHGGGWVLGDLDSSDSICKFIADQSDCLVMSVDYRLAPEHPYPLPLKDAWDAMRWASRSVGAWGGDPTRLWVGGESAGANLAAAVAIKCRNENMSPVVAGQLLITPVTNYSFETASYRENSGINLTRERMVWFWNHYLQYPQQGLESYASPLLVGNASGLPPAIVVTAENDVLRDEGEAYARLLGRDGVFVRYLFFPRLVHSFIHMAGNSRRAWDAFTAIADAFREELHVRCVDSPSFHAFSSV